MAVKLKKKRKFKVLQLSDDERLLAHHVGALLDISLIDVFHTCEDNLLPPFDQVPLL